MKTKHQSFFLLILCTFQNFLALDASENNLPQMKYVLYPKPAGLLTCLATLRDVAIIRKRRSSNSILNKSEVDNPMIIHDLTIAYKDAIDGVRTTDKRVFAGMMTGSVIAISDIYAI